MLALAKSKRGVFVGILLWLLFVWLLVGGPVLMHLRFGPLRGNPRFTLWNPIRSRAPERYAVAQLRKIQSQNCRAEIEDWQIPAEDKDSACNKQVRDAVVSHCDLIDRRDIGSATWLLFSCPYRSRPQDWADVDVTVTENKGFWIVDAYERIY